MAAKWGAPIAAATDHKHARQIGQAATTQTLARDDQLMNAATQAQAVAPLPNGLADFSLVVKMARFMARERGADWALKPPEAKGARVARHQDKAATNYRVDQVAQKESGRPQILQKFRELTATQTPPAEIGRAVHAEANRRSIGKAKYDFDQADGAVWNWNKIEDRFNHCLKGMAIYHGATQLRANAHELLPEEAQAKTWVEPLHHQHKHGQEADVHHTQEALLAQRQAAGLTYSDLLQREHA